MCLYTSILSESHYSLLDGLSKPSQIAERCSNIGVSSCALTDHGSISGTVQFYQAMKAKNIKPILGCEIYICNQDSHIKTKENSDLSHFLLLAKNYDGWKTLIRIISESNNEKNFYHKPRLDFSKLESLLDNNIIGYCGHLGSSLADLICSSKESVDKIGTEFIAKMKSLFGSDNFFLEAQLMDQEFTPLQKEMTEHIRRLGSLTNTKVICTPDAHYCSKEDAIDQRILLCNNLKTTLVDINKKLINDQDVPMSCFFKSDNFHILSPEEMIEIHKEEEIENTNYVNSLVEEYDILHKPLLPEFQCPNNYNPDEYLRQLCRNGWKQKIEKKIPKENHQIYINRIKHELEVLQEAGLSSYFLIVHDIVKYVKNQNWLAGCGRGSAAGCLVSYLIDITDIDPIKYNLLFERFYSTGRNISEQISFPEFPIKDFNSSV
ncbi:MAG: PHP domain-containing protein [Caulobacteraceae bacterium]|nr:PHP domain-containing protein [Caulobacteraceae bacterium]